MELYDYLAALVSTPTVSGFEKRGAERIADLSLAYADGFFDGFRVLPSGSLLFERSCGKPNAKKLVLDAHMDTIGFAVSEVCGGGFVKVINLGGVDAHILPAAPVYLYGRQTVYGVFSSVPPHLAANPDTALKVSDLFVDTGLGKSAFEQAGIAVGTPVGFAEPPVLLQNRVVASHSLDDKACIAAIFHACRSLAAKRRVPAETDVLVHLSTGEEKTALGAKTLPYVLDGADGCLVLDVNFARTAGVEPYEALALGDGPGVSYSATVKRELTDFITAAAKRHGLPLQSVVEMCSTGTNATQIHRNGIPSAVLSLPLKNMHTYAECVSLADMESFAALLAWVMCEFHTSAVGEVHFK